MKFLEVHKKKTVITLPEYFLLAASNCALRMPDIVST